MAGNRGTGRAQTRWGRRGRRFGVALLAVAQLGIMGLAPGLDAAPAPAAHQHHLADDAAPGCQPQHDAHCVLCRVLSTEALGAIGVQGPAVRGPHLATSHAARDTAPRSVRTPSPLQARAPPGA